MPSLPFRVYYWLKRFRHRRGYGVHSPFAFSYITEVIYERGTYYAYKSLDSRFRAVKKSAFRRKDFLLCFRIANRSKADTIFCSLSFNDLLRETFVAARRNAVFIDRFEEAFLRVFDGRLPLPTDFLKNLPTGGVAVIAFFDNCENRAQKEKLMQPIEDCISFDLHTFLIIIRRPDLFSTRYPVNYF